MHTAQAKPASEDIVGNDDRVSAVVNNVVGSFIARRSEGSD